MEERIASREVSLTDPDSDAVSEYKAASTQSEQFCGIVTGSEYGVVDTAAEGGLVGSFALHRLESRLKDIGLKVKWIPKRSLAKGVGGQAKVLGVVLIPIGIGGLNGVLEATVVEGEVPLLLPVKLMKNLKAIVDFNQYKFILPDEELHIPLHELPSGHVTIDVLQFQPSGFAVPSTAPFSSNDFVEKEVHNRAMLAQFVNKIQKLCPPLRRPHSRFGEEHVGLGGASGQAADLERGRKGERRQDEKLRQETKDGSEELASAVGQAVHSPGLRGTAAAHPRMATRVALSFGAIYAAVKGGRQFGSLLSEDHHQCQGFAPLEVKRSSDGLHEHLRTPQGAVEGRREQERFLHLLQDVPLQMGISVDGGRHQRRLEEGKEGPLESKDGRSQDGTGSESPRQGEGSVGERTSRDVARTATAASRLAGERSPHRSDDEGIEDPEARAPGDDSEGSDSRSRSTSEEDPREASGGGDTSMPVQRNGREGLSSRREDPGREVLLGVQVGQLRLLSEGAHEGNQGQSPKRDELPDAGKHSLEQPSRKEEQKSKAGEEDQQRRNDPSTRQRLEDGLAEAHSKKGRQALRKMQVKSHPFLEAPRTYEVFQREEGWKEEEEEGLVSLQEERPVRVKSRLNQKEEIAEKKSNSTEDKEKK